MRCERCFVKCASVKFAVTGATQVVKKVRGDREALKREIELLGSDGCLWCHPRCEVHGCRFLCGTRASYGKSGFLEVASALDVDVRGSV